MVPPEDVDNPPADDDERFTPHRLVGQVLLGTYRVDRQIDEGGMARVYKGKNTNLHKPVVIKVPHSHLMRNERTVQRFQDEIDRLSSLQHPNIVRIVAQGKLGALPYFVLEFLGGGSLHQRLRDAPGGRLTIEQVLRWSRRIAEALDYIHSRGVIHRDVKPANILFDDAGNAYVADFGISKAVRDDAEQDGMTLTGEILGSPPYMSPEQLAAKPVDGRADQYALATTIYKALTGQTPFPKGSALSIAQRKNKEDPPLANVAYLGVRANVAQALDNGLSREASQRYGTCTALIEALSAAMLQPLAETIRPTGHERTRVIPGAQVAETKAETHPATRTPIPSESPKVSPRGVSRVEERHRVERRRARPEPTPALAWLIPAVVTVLLLAGAVMAFILEDLEIPGILTVCAAIVGALFWLRPPEDELEADD